MDVWARGVMMNQVGRVKLVNYRSQACGDWIGFTVVANLALTASGVGRGSYPDSPGGRIIILHYC